MGYKDTIEANLTAAEVASDESFKGNLQVAISTANAFGTKEEQNKTEKRAQEIRDNRD